MKNNPNNIYLVGMMGSGKSVTGKALAALLDAAFVDLDAAIEEEQARAISEIFAEFGEPYFRKLEATILEYFSLQSGQVIATGGGIVLREENVRCMKNTGTVVLLKASAETLWQRVRYSQDRPLLNKPDPLGTLRQILDDREDFYQKACDFAVVTDGKIAEDVAEEIREHLRSMK